MARKKKSTKVTTGVKLPKFKKSRQGRASLKSGKFKKHYRGKFRHTDK